MADIPGLIEGAAEGAGLGIQFLKHLSRTRLLLHLVDASAEPEMLARDVHIIEAELAKFSAELADQPRWLVLTKADLLPAEERGHRLQSLQSALQWQAPAFIISAVSGTGTQDLVHAIMDALQSTSATSEPPSET